ncbi:MAG: HlyC/CorC family transporter [Phycisphaeraceae bacterium]|nr:MAG: HlyC/CorC family transporter [Phycisphaeraceae bacterium]
MNGWAAWIAVSSVALGALFSALFHALSDLSRGALEQIARARGSAGKRRQIDAVLHDLDGHARAVALPRIACNALAAVAVTLWVSDLRGQASPGWIDVGVGVPITALAVWVFGLVIPSSVARHAGEQAVYALTPLIRVIYVVTRPITRGVRVMDEVVRRLSGRSESDAGEDIKDEVLSVVEDARHEGKFDEAEQDMIEAVVQFRDITVEQIMTPRTEIEAMELTNDLGKVTAMLRKGGHSRIPVYEGTIDRIVGVFYVKDLMRWLAGEGSRGGRVFDLRQILRPAHFVPGSKTVRELLQELTEKRVHIAIVADEFGGTAGLVTIEDIVEEVFGDIQDEYEQPGDEPVPARVDAGSGRAELDARAYIADVNESLRDAGLELPESEDYDTVGGWVTVTLGRIPAAGESVALPGASGELNVTVLEAEPTRVTRVRVARREGSPEDDASDQREVATNR